MSNSEQPGNNQHQEMLELSNELKEFFEGVNLTHAAIKALICIVFAYLKTRLKS